MSSVFGNRIKVSVFGQSHSEAIGVVIDSLPAGFEPDMEKLRRFTMRRTAIGKEGVTARKEPDEAEILRTCQRKDLRRAALRDHTEHRCAFLRL